MLFVLEPSDILPMWQDIPELELCFLFLAAHAFTCIVTAAGTVEGHNRNVSSLLCSLVPLPSVLRKHPASLRPFVLIRHFYVYYVFVLICIIHCYVLNHFLATRQDGDVFRSDQTSKQCHDVITLSAQRMQLPYPL